jgi:hypothetical protein
MCYQIEGKIKWADSSDHPHRSSQPKTEVTFSRGHGIQGNGLTMDPLGFLSRQGESADSPIDLNQSKLHRFTRFDGDSFCKFLFAFSDQCGCPGEYFRTPVGWQISYQRGCSLRSCDGCVHIFLPCGRQDRADLLRVFVSHLHPLPSIYPLTINKEFVFHLRILLCLFQFFPLIG